jgi:hypothetical protein
MIFLVAGLWFEKVSEEEGGREEGSVLNQLLMLLLLFFPLFFFNISFTKYEIIFLKFKVPSWFSMVWNIVKGLLTARSVAKINILRGDYLNELNELVHMNDIPVIFGGQCTLAPYNGALEIEMKKHVDLINQNFSKDSR